MSDRDRIAFSARGLSSERAGRLVLSNIELDIPAARITVLVGPSGAGKSSLLRLLNRLDEPSCGDIIYRGRPLLEWPVRELRRRVGFVFQTPVMFAGSLRDNLQAAARIAAAREADFAALAARVIERAELEPSLLDRPGDELSVGQQQRANLARALMTGPETLLLDEPTSALDSVTAARLLETVRRLCRDEGLTVVFATHRVDEARQIADSVLALRDGAVQRPGGRASGTGRGEPR